MLDLLILSFPVIYGLFLSRLIGILLCQYRQEVDTSFDFSIDDSFHDSALLEEVKKESHRERLLMAKDMLHEYFDSSSDSIADHLKLPRMSVRSLCKRSKRTKNSKNNDYDLRIVN